MAMILTQRMEKFFCPNCKFKKHQCYACGKLGCSDEAAGAAQEVSTGLGNITTFGLSNLCFCVLGLVT